MEYGKRNASSSPDVKAGEDNTMNYRYLLDAYIRCTSNDMTMEKRELVWEIITRLYNARLVLERVVEKVAAHNRPRANHY